MTVPALIDPKDLAIDWGVPKAALIRCAEDHGLLVRIGTAKKIAETDLLELISKCRVKPNQPASFSEPEPTETPSMSSSTGAGKKARAQDISKRLKRTSKRTSPAKSAEVVPMKREN